MARRYPYILVILAFFLLPLGRVYAIGRGAEELVLSGSEIYDAATAVFLESGIWNFSDNVPCTIEELRFYLEEVDRERLSPVGKRAYDSIEDYFSEELYTPLEWSLFKGKPTTDEGDVFRLKLEPSISLEGQYKANDNVDWVYDRYQRRPLIDLPMILECGDYFTIMCDLYLKLNRSRMEDDDCYANIPLEADDIDVNFPTTAYFSTGRKLTKGTGVSFTLGMAEHSMGRTMKGSIIMSEYLTGATSGTLKAYSRNIHFASSIEQLNVDRYFYYHKLDVRLFKRVTFSAIEGQLAAHSMELRFLNPYTIFHGFSPWRDYSPEEDTNTCAYMGAKLVVVPIKYLRIYGLFAQTQYQTPYETSNWDDSLTPNGMGGQAGAESYIPLKKGYLHSWFEFYYAQPYLYLKPTQEASMVRAYREDVGDTDRVNYEWIGSPYGPDTVAYSASIGYEMPLQFKIKLGYSLSIKGMLSEDDIFNNWHGEVHSDRQLFDIRTGEYTYSWKGYPVTEDERDRVAPSGIEEYTNTVTLYLSYHTSPNVEFSLVPSASFLFNRDHKEGRKSQCFEVAASMRIYFLPHTKTVTDKGE